MPVALWGRTQGGQTAEPPNDLSIRDIVSERRAASRRPQWVAEVADFKEFFALRGNPAATKAASNEP